MSYAALRSDPEPGAPLTRRVLLRAPELRFTGHWYWIRGGPSLTWYRLPIQPPGKRCGRVGYKTLTERREIFQLWEEGYDKLGIVIAYNFPIYYYPGKPHTPLSAYMCLNSFLRYHRAWWEREKQGFNA